MVGLYAIVGIKKLKTAGNIQGVMAHATRMRYTANSNGKTNDVLMGPPSLEELMKDIRACCPRKNAVLCYDVLLTASPEWFQGKTEEQIRAWEEKSLAWAREKFGTDNIRMCICHRDETTPHLSLLITPITPEGKLNARAWTGGRDKLRALWTEYGQAMKPLGLERGREFSPAKHQDIKAYYSAVKQAMKRTERKAERQKDREGKLPAFNLKEKIKPFKMKREHKSLKPDTMRTGRKPPSTEAGRDTGR